MGIVHKFQPRAEKVDRASLMSDLQQKEAQGRIRSFMYFCEKLDGETTFGISGGFSERLQLASYTLAKALAQVNEEIVSKGLAGNCPSVATKHRFPPYSSTPRRGH
jgi:hypothetical protein